MRRVLSLVALVLLASCGGTPPPETPVAKLPPTPKGGADVAPAFDLSPVPVPASVTVFGRLSHPSRTVDMVSAWTAQPLDPQGPLGEFLGDRVARLVDLDHEFDFVVIVKRVPQPALVISVPLKGGMDGIKAELSGRYDFMSGPNGATELVKKARAKKPTDDDDDDDDDYRGSDFKRCALAPSFGAAAVRLVCAKDGSARDAALPYLTRGLTRETYAADLHVEARPEPWRDFLKNNKANVPMLVGGIIGHDQEVREAMTAGFEDMFDLGLDAAHATLDVNLDAQQGSGTLRIALQQKTSLTARMLTSHPERAEAMSAAFAKLPADTAWGFFVHGIDADLLARPKQLSAKAVENLLQNRPELDPQDRKAFGDAVVHLMDLFANPMAYGRGLDPSQASVALSSWEAKKTDVGREKAALALVAGWDALGVEAPIATVQVPIKEFIAAFNRPHVQKWMKAKNGADFPAPTWKAAGAMKDAPSGALHFELTTFNEDVDNSPPPPAPAPGTKFKPSPPRAKRPPITTKMHTLVFADGARTWIVNGLDEATVVGKAKAILGGTDSLAKRPDLEALRSTPTNAGGFISLRGLGSYLPFRYVTRTPSYVLDADPLFGMSTPQAGMVALPFWFNEEGPKADAPAGALTANLRVPRAEVADFLSVGLRLFH